MPARQSLPKLNTSLSTSIAKAADAALNLIYPAVCQVCREERATADEGYVGPKCRAKIRYVVPPFCERCGLPYSGEITGPFECANCLDVKLHFRSARSAVVADTMMLDIVGRYKYQPARWFEPFLAGLLIAEAKPALTAEHWDFIVPVPLHPIKRREREFNQAERMAERLAQATNIPVNARLVRRVKATTTQTRLSREERAANVSNAFAFCGEQELSGERVVLVDDVMTTGATTNACAAALRKGGAGEICVWTVARAVATGT